MRETNFRIYDVDSETSELYELDRKWLERRRLGIYPKNLVCAFSDQVSRLIADGMDEDEALESVFIEMFL